MARTRSAGSGLRAHRGRAIAGAAVGLVLAGLTGANAYVRLAAEAQLQQAQRLWPNHPAVLRSAALNEVGTAAAQGREPGDPTLEKAKRLAASAPLEPEPFLINGALALRSGDAAKGEQLIIEARRRDPRSAAARFLLADHYLRSGSTLKGLQELAVLGRLVSGASMQLVPGLAAYAKQAGAAAELKRLLAANPELEAPVLAALSQDPANADLVLQLAGPGAAAVSPTPPWQRQLLQGLIKSGQFGKARAIWGRFAGLPPLSTGIYRPDFGASPAPPPFNWSFAEAGGGIAEPITGGGLRVLYYGRDDVVLAAQTLTLPAGRYRLSMTVGGDLANAQQLRWVLRCLPAEKPVFELPLSNRKGRSLSANLVVPSGGCGAQQLELRGVGEEMAKSADVTMGPLQLVRVAG